MNLSRRRFLGKSAASLAVISGTSQIPSVWLQAASASLNHADPAGNVLVVIQLSGGNDGLNTVIPYGDDLYARNRFQTRISDKAVLRIDDYLGLHPAMMGMSRLFQENRLAIVQGVGYENPNRSHFESMDIWHSATTETSRTTRQAGWLGKYLDAASSANPLPAENQVPAVHLGSEVQPLALAGLQVQVPSIGSLDSFRFDETSSPQLAELRDRLLTSKSSSTNVLLAHVQSAAQTALNSSRRVRSAIRKRSSTAEYPGTELGKRLHGIAQLIQAGLATKIYYVILDGFDTHSLQSETHAGLLRELSRAVTAFMDDLQARGHSERVLVACFSEFGRRVRENASRGTDHGAAAPMFFAGGKLRGGILGGHPSLVDLVDGDLRFHTDFRSVYASVLEGWLGVASKPLLGKSYPLLKLFASS